MLVITLNDRATPVHITWALIIPRGLAGRATQGHHSVRTDF
jgi:hypothetical protein